MMEIFSSINHTVSEEGQMNLADLTGYEAARMFRQYSRSVEYPTLSPCLTGDLRSNYEKVFSHPFFHNRAFANHNYASRLSIVIEFLHEMLAKTQSPLKILDAGSGFGSESILFALLDSRLDCVGIELRKETYDIAVARQKFYAQRFSRISLRFENMNIFDILEHDRSLRNFHIVFVAEAISHIHPAEDFIDLVCSQLLVDDGFLIISDSNSLNPLVRLLMLRRFWRHGSLYYVIECPDPIKNKNVQFAVERLFSPVSMDRLCARRGLVRYRRRMSGLLLPPLYCEKHRERALLMENILNKSPLSLLGGIYTTIYQKRSMQ